MMVRQKEPQLDIEGAGRLAIEGLAFLASEPEELGRFLALVGLGPETLLVFAARANIRPTLIAAARYLLDRDFHE